jgi:25S rRNA (adenine2142-N1)-methyltransferase
MTHDHFTKLVESIGFDLQHHHLTPKLAYYVFKKGQFVGKSTGRHWKKQELNPGTTRNNFCITLN